MTPANVQDIRRFKDASNPLKCTIGGVEFVARVRRVDVTGSSVDQLAVVVELVGQLVDYTIAGAEEGAGG